MAIPAHLPGVAYADPPRGTSGPLSPLPPRLVVIHATANTRASARDEARYAATRTDPSSRWTSAHFYCDPSETVGSQLLTMRAWAALAHGNAIGWHIEICGASGALPAAAVARAAGLTRALCQLGGIPMDYLGPAAVRAGGHGITGHADITLAYPEDRGDHTDPGWGPAQWSAFIEQVRAEGRDAAMTLVELYGKLIYENWSPSKDDWARAGGDPAVYAQLEHAGSGRNQLALALANITSQVEELAARPTGALTDAQVAAIADRLAATVPSLEQIAAAVCDELARRAAA